MVTASSVWGAVARVTDRGVKGRKKDGWGKVCNLSLQLPNIFLSAPSWFLFFLLPALALPNLCVLGTCLVG